MTVQARKYLLIEQITNIDDEALLRQIAQFISSSKSQIDRLSSLVKPMPEKLDIEALKAEQNYTGFDQQKVERLIQEADINEPIEELIEMI